MIFEEASFDFNAAALEMFRYQSKNNKIYSQYLSLLNKRPEEIKQVEDIPFLPIELFKKHQIVSGDLGKNFDVFTSSSTSKQGLSKHYVKDIEIYKLSFLKSFEKVFGNPKNITFRFLLPSYLERSGSSLVWMANELLNMSGKGGFYLHNLNDLALHLKEDQKLKKNVMLFGVSFALLEFAKHFPMELTGIAIVETGGMKGRAPEITRDELHHQLKKAFKVKHIASEYGMTELLSQAYALKQGFFNCPPWMRVLIRDHTDPFASENTQRTGAINIIDLANMDSCCFIATSDLGRMHDDGSFEVLGRLDGSEQRGCNLLF